MMSSLKWFFPPTHGGVAQGFNDSGKEYFTADVLEHVVREIIQNSLDAKDHRHDGKPVIIDMSEMELGGGYQCRGTSVPCRKVS